MDLHVWCMLCLCWPPYIIGSSRMMRSVDSATTFSNPPQVNWGAAESAAAQERRQDLHAEIPKVVSAVLLFGAEHHIVPVARASSLPRHEFSRSHA